MLFKEYNKITYYSNNIKKANDLKSTILHFK